MSDQTTTEVVAEPFENRDEITFHAEGVGYTVAVGDEIPHAKTTYANVRYPAEVVSIFMDPRGLPGGRFETANGHKCTPTIEIEMQIPEDAEHSHLDGKRYRWECYNAPYTLALREDLPEGDYDTITTYEPDEAGE